MRNNHNFLIAVILVPMAFVIGACSDYEDKPSNGIEEVTGSLSKNPIEQSKVSTLGNYKVMVKSEPSPIPMNKMFSLHISMKSVDNIKISSWPELTVDAIMPAHQHGMTVKTKVKPMGDGTFHVDGMLFHMPGDWQIRLFLKNGKLVETVTFDYAI